MSIDAATMGAALKLLEGSGLSFVVHENAPGGTNSIVTDADGALLWFTDHAAFFAAKHGVSKEDWKAWQADEFNVRCSSRTARGRRCRNHVIGGTAVDVQHYVRLRGGYCNAHGGD